MKRPAALRQMMIRAIALSALVQLFPAFLEAQAPRPTFDYVSTLKIAQDAPMMARGDLNGDGVPDLIVAGPGGYNIFIQGKTSFEWNLKSGSVLNTPALLVTGRVNADSRDDLVIYSSEPPSVSVYLSGRDGVPVLNRSFDVPADIGRMLVVDLDGDGRSDILLFGKKKLGIDVFRGDGSGNFTQGPVLFPDISISLAYVTGMDDDDLPDLVSVNWISDEILISSGFGKMNFSDPGVIPFAEEPVAIAAGDLNADGFRDIVAGFAERPSLKVMTGNGTGKFTEFTAVDLPYRPAKIRIGDADGDGLNDLMIFTPERRSISVRFFDRADPFRREEVFSTGVAAIDVIFFLDSRKRVLNAAVLPESGTILRILHNRSERFPGAAGWQFVTGTDPTDMEVADVNADGWADILMTQNSNRVVNVYLNNGRGNLLGMVSLKIPEAARDILAVTADSGRTNFLMTGVDGRSLSYIRMRGKTDGKAGGMIFDNEFPPEVSTVRAESGLEAIDAGSRDEAAITRIYAICPGGEEGQFRICAYDVVNRTRYEEIEIPLAIKSKPLAMLSHDFNVDGMRDLAVISRLDSSEGLALMVLKQTPESFVPDKRAIFAIETGPSPSISLWAGDLDADGHDDLIINVGKPLDGLFVAMAAGDSGFGPMVRILTGVRVPRQNALEVVDFNSDGIRDLVFMNDRTRTIQFLPGDGTGRFAGPVNLMSAKNASGFCVADLNRDSEQELLVAGGESGILTITSFHHPLFGLKR